MIPVALEIDHDTRRPLGVLPDAHALKQPVPDRDAVLVVAADPDPLEVDVQAVGPAGAPVRAEAAHLGLDRPRELDDDAGELVVRIVQDNGGLNRVVVE